MRLAYRPLREGEHREFLRPISLAMNFPQSYDRGDGMRALLPASRCVVAEDDGEIVGTAGAYELELTVPGGPVPCAGIVAVAVLPTHRRRGILRELMRLQLDAFHEQGEPLAALWASEAQIYGRFGYGLASLCGTIELERDHAAWVDGPPEPVAARLVDVDEAVAACGVVYDRLRVGLSGLVSRTEHWWRGRILREPGDHHRVVFDGPDGPEAYALYRMRDLWTEMIPTGRLEVQEVLATSPAALRRAWGYLFGIDLIDTVSAGFLPVDHPLLLWLAEPNRLRFRLQNALWLRLVDVGGALGRRAYAEDGAVVFDLRDGFCPWNEGRWRLEDGEAVRTDGDADLALDVTALGAAYLGGFTFAELVRAGRAEELRDGGTARADALFRVPQKPWTPEIF